MLRDPPPNLLMLSATLPDESTPTVLVNEVKHSEPIVAETTVHAVEPKSKVEEPVHDRQHRWSAQKRLKKVQVKTLEMVYRRSKRPTVSKAFSTLMYRRKFLSISEMDLLKEVAFEVITSLIMKFLCWL